jgi:hypothetical protein
MPMGQNTTTFNIDELITSYIDNQIPDAELRSQIEQMIASDSRLNAKYRSELLTRNMLCQRLPKVELPGSTYQKVLSSIDSLIAEINLKKNRDYSLPEIQRDYPSFWQSLKESVTAKFIGVPRYAFAVLLVIVVSGVFVFGGGKKTTNPHILAGTEKSIMVQALKNFNKVVKGEVKPQLTTSNAAEVEQYVKTNAEFNAYIPVVDNYILTGVVVNEFNGQKIAHLIYAGVNDVDEMLYVYQTPVTCFQKKNLDIPEQVHSEILTATYYMCDGVDETDCTMTLWYKNNVVCASVSTMPKQDMQVAFARFNK